MSSDQSIAAKLESRQSMWGRIATRFALGRQILAIATAVCAACILHAQVADDSTGVSVAVKIFNVGWDGAYDPSSDTDTPTLTANITGLNGTLSTDTLNYNDTETVQIMPRLVVGQTYELTIDSDRVVSGSLQAVPPPGYVMEIEQVPREKYDFGSPSVIKLRVRPPDGAPPGRGGVATALRIERTLWDVSLGSLSNGQSAGAIQFIDVGAGSAVSSIFSPNGLIYDAPSSEVQVIYNPSNVSAPYVPNTIKQIIAPQVCVDVYMGGSDECELKFYHRAQLGAQDQTTGIYGFTGAPFAWYFFNQNGTTPNGVKISCDIRDTTIVDPSTGALSIDPNTSNTFRSKVTTLLRSGNAPNYTWTAEDWYENVTGSNSIVENVRSRNGTSETLTTATPGATAPTLQLVRTYTAEPWGNEVTHEEVGTNHTVLNQLTGASGTSSSVGTDYTFESTTDTQSATYSRLMSHISGGQWEAYEYYDYTDGIALAGTIKKIHRPFDKNATSVPDLANDPGEITTYTYGNDAYGRATRPTGSTTTVNGTTTAQTTITYTDSPSGFTGHASLYLVTSTRKDYSSSGNYLTTVTKYFREDAGDPILHPGATADDFFRSQIHSVRQPNGVQQSFVYQRGTWNGSAFSPSSNSSGVQNGLEPISGSFATRICSITGSSDSTKGTYCSSVYGYPIDPIYLVVDTTSEPGITKCKSTMDVTIRDSYARVVRSEKYVWGGSDWQLIGATNLEWNYSNELLKRATNQSTTYDLSSGTLYEASYYGERLTSETNESGVTTSYDYDTSDRVQTMTQSAAGTVTTGTIGALATQYQYDAAGHVTGMTTGVMVNGSFTGETISSSRQYDDAGRLQESDQPGPGGWITTTYVYDPANRTTTTNLPNGGQRVEAAQPSGAVDTVSGSATVEEDHAYNVESTGQREETISIGGSSSLRKQQHWSDWLGRTVKSWRPGFGTQPGFVEEANYDVVTGQLLSTTRHDDTPSQSKLYADTVYAQYDAFSYPTRVGMDVDQSGALELASGTDRISEDDQYFAVDAAKHWWFTKTSKTYPTKNSGTALLVATSRQRLTGFSSGQVQESVAIDADGNSTDRVVTLSDRSNAVTTVTTTVMDANGKPVFANDDIETIVAGSTLSVRHFDGLTASVGYDALHRVKTATDSRGNTATSSYYTGTTFVSYVQDAGTPTPNKVVTYIYDAAGQVITTIDANGKIARVEYNVRGQVVRSWGDSTYPVEYGYDSAYGDRTSMKTFRGGSGWNSNVGDHSNKSNPWPAATTGTPSWTVWVYDPATGLLSTKYDGANVDASGNPISGAKKISYAYNARGQIETRTLARGVATTYGYDGMTGELTSRSYSDGSTPSVGYIYTRTGQLDSVTETNSDSTVALARTFSYAASNPTRLDKVTLDASDAPGAVVPAYYGSRVLTRQYDSIFRPSGFKLGSSSNGAADLTQTYTYNAQGRFDHVDTLAGSQTNASSFVYSYESDSALISGYTAGTRSGATYTAGSFAVGRQYEPHRNLLTKIDSQWNGASKVCYDYVYTNLAQRYTAKQSGAVWNEYGGSTYRRYVYNDRGEMTSGADYFGDTPLALGADPSAVAQDQLPSRNFAYSFDNIGNRQTADRNGLFAPIKDGSGNITVPVDQTYGMDSAHGSVNEYSSRTNAYVHAAGTVSSSTTSVGVSGGGMGWVTGMNSPFWAADAQIPPSNASSSAPLTVTAKIAGSATTNDIVETDSSRTAVVPPATQTFTYDDDGNLKSDGLWLYTYDAENRLTAIETDPVVIGFVPSANARRLEFQYDYLGRRVQKLVRSGWNASTQSYSNIAWQRRYVYDGSNVVAELSGDGANVTRSFTWGLDLAGSLSSTDGVGALLQITDNSTATSISYFPMYDGNGNITGLLNASDGSVAAKYEYSPFGELLHCEGSYALNNPFRFSTKFTDDETGLVYYGARYFSPNLGRFINRDPIEEAGGLNLYGFCGNDGINRFDIGGHGWWSRLKHSVSHFWDKFRYTIISTVIRVVGDIICPGMGEVLSGLFDAAVSYTHGGGLSGAVWAAAGGISSGLGIGSLVSDVAEAHSLYTSFNHGNFFTDLRDVGENYLVASATEASVNGADAVAKGSTFKNGFTASVQQQVGRLEGVVADTQHLVATGRFQTSMVLMGRPTVVGYEDVDYGLEFEAAAPERLSAEEIAASERVVAADRRIYDLQHPSAAAAVYGGFAQYRGAFAAAEWMSNKVAQGTVMALGGFEAPAAFGELELEEAGIAETVAAGPGGLGQDLLQYSENVTPKEGVTDVFCHADAEAFYVKRGEEWIELSHSDLANCIESQGIEGDIRLIACNAGKGNLAQFLSNRLGVSVEAATSKVYISKYTVCDPMLEAGGEWKVFTPGN